MARKRTQQEKITMSEVETTNAPETPVELPFPPSGWLTVYEAVQLVQPVLEANGGAPAAMPSFINRLVTSDPIFEGRQGVYKIPQFAGDARYIDGDAINEYLRGVESGSRSAGKRGGAARKPGVTRYDVSRDGSKVGTLALTDDELATLRDLLETRGYTFAKAVRKSKETNDAAAQDGAPLGSDQASFDALFPAE
jgi:hypothetical protein